MHKIGLGVVCSMALLQGVAHAGDFTLSGYGSLSASHFSSDEAKYRTTPWQGTGVGKNWDAGSDSKLGVQGSYKINDSVSGTLHVLSQQNVNGTFGPRVEWAYLNYKASPNLEVRAGRLGLPAFLASDYLNVNYSMTAVRGPVEVYSQLPISHFDGVDLLWRTKVGSANVTVQPLAGHSDFQARFSDAAGTLADGKADVYGMNVVTELGDWTMRAGYIGAKVSIESSPTNQVIAGLQGMGATDTANRLNYRDRNSSFAGIGIGYDDGQKLMQAEYTQRRAYGFLSDTNSWYVLGGYRIGQFTPYVIAAEQKVVSASNWGNVTSDATMNANVNGLIGGSNTSQRSCSVGVRWDFAKNLAAKAQLSRITPENGSNAGLLMYSGANTLGVQNLLTVSVDAVF